MEKLPPYIHASVTEVLPSWFSQGLEDGAGTSVKSPLTRQGVTQSIKEIQASPEIQLAHSLYYLQMLYTGGTRCLGLLSFLRT